MVEVPRAGAYWQDPHPPTAPTAIPAAAFAPIFGERANAAPAAAAPAAAAPAAAAPAAAAPAAAAPVSQVWSGVADATGAGPADGAQDTSSDGGSPLTPRWGDVSLTSFDAITRPESDPAPDVSPARPESRQTEAVPAPHQASYTWLHMLALALVAFIFGFLVWLLINRSSTQPGTASAFAPAPTTSMSGTSSPHQGEL